MGIVTRKHPATAGGDCAESEKTIPIWESGKQTRWHGYTQRESFVNFMSKLHLSLSGDFNLSKSSA